MIDDNHAQLDGCKAFTTYISKLPTMTTQTDIAIATDAMRVSHDLAITIHRIDSIMMPN